LASHNYPKATRKPIFNAGGAAATLRKATERCGASGSRADDVAPVCYRQRHLHGRVSVEMKETRHASQAQWRGPSPLSRNILWDSVRQMRDITRMKIVLNGIITPDGHSSIDALPEIIAGGAEFP
jgi:hypothetical protein